MRSPSVERALEIACKNGMEDLYLLWVKECQVYFNTMFEKDTKEPDILALRKAYPLKRP